MICRATRLCAVRFADLVETVELVEIHGVTEASVHAGFCHK